MTDIVDEHVSSRAAYFRKLHAEAQAVYAAKREGNPYGPYSFTKDELMTMLLPNQVFFELAYGLDEAMAALKFYGNADTWKEVPDHTYAAQDVGLKARVAMARINPV